MRPLAGANNRYGLGAQEWVQMVFFSTHHQILERVMSEIEAGATKRSQVTVFRTRSRRPCALSICSRQMIVLKTVT